MKPLRYKRVLRLPQMETFRNEGRETNGLLRKIFGKADLFGKRVLHAANVSLVGFPLWALQRFLNTIFHNQC